MYVTSYVEDLQAGVKDCFAAASGNHLFAIVNADLKVYSVANNIILLALQYSLGGVGLWLDVSPSGRYYAFCMGTRVFVSYKSTSGGIWPAFEETVNCFSVSVTNNKLAISYDTQFLVYEINCVFYEAMCLAACPAGTHTVNNIPECVTCLYDIASQNCVSSCPSTTF
jgi:hypothetical protein